MFKSAFQIDEEKINRTANEFFRKPSSKVDFYTIFMNCHNGSFLFAKRKSLLHPGGKNFYIHLQKNY